MGHPEASAFSALEFHWSFSAPLQGQRTLPLTPDFPDPGGRFHPLTSPGAGTGLVLRPIQIGLQLVHGRLADLHRTSDCFVLLSPVRCKATLLVNGILFALHGADRILQFLVAVFRIIEGVRIAAGGLLSLLIVRDGPFLRQVGAEADAFLLQCGPGQLYRLLGDQFLLLLLLGLPQIPTGLIQQRQRLVQFFGGGNPGTFFFQLFFQFTNLLLTIGLPPEDSPSSFLSRSSPCFS